MGSTLTCTHISCTNMPGRHCFGKQHFPRCACAMRMISCDMDSCPISSTHKVMQRCHHGRAGRTIPSTHLSVQRCHHWRAGPCMCGRRFKAAIVAAARLNKLIFVGQCLSTEGAAYAHACVGKHRGWMPSEDSHELYIQTCI